MKFVRYLILFFVLSSFLVIAEDDLTKGEELFVKDVSPRVSLRYEKIKEKQELDDETKNYLTEFYSEIDEEDAPKLRRLEFLDEESYANIKSVNTISVEELINLPRGRVKKYLKEYSVEELNTVEISSKISSEWIEKRNIINNGFVLRNFSNSDKEINEMMFNKLKQKHTESKQEYLDLRGPILSNVNIEKCFTNFFVNNPICEAVTPQSKEFLLSSAKNILYSLELLHHKLLTSDRVSESRSSLYLGEINSSIDSINNNIN
jgi:hypothetical protein